MEDRISLPLSNLQHLRVGWQEVCDRYNTTAYVTRLLGSAGLACYTNRSDAEAAGTHRNSCPGGDSRPKNAPAPLGRQSGRRVAQARNEYG